jgi:hypothetical protein
MPEKSLPGNNKAARLPRPVGHISRSPAYGEALEVVQVDQDLQGGETANSARISAKKAKVGSLSNQVLAFANQFLPHAQLRFPITAGHDLPQTALAQGGDFQWNRRMF